MSKPTIEAITAETLPEFAAFLEAHMSVSRSAAEWTTTLSTHWRGPRPNYGFLMRDEGKVVGGIGAIYAERAIGGKVEHFCNITSWCVLDRYRKFSMQLAMAVVAQRAYHFTDFSPTKVVSSTLQFLKFKPLDEAVFTIVNLPRPLVSGQVITDPSRIERELKGDALDIWRDHKRFPWLRHLLLGKPGQWCHIIYKKGLVKSLPCARILHVGDAQIFERLYPRAGWHFLASGMVFTQVERRLLHAPPWPSRLSTGFNRKVFLSDSLPDETIDYLYSESVALDL